MRYYISIRLPLHQLQCVYVRYVLKIYCELCSSS